MHFLVSNLQRKGPKRVERKLNERRGGSECQRGEKVFERAKEEKMERGPFAFRPEPFDMLAPYIRRERQ